jgi:archaellum component FlaC
MVMQIMDEDMRDFLNNQIDDILDEIEGLKTRIENIKYDMQYIRRSVN